MSQVQKTTPAELPPQYDPTAFESEVQALWKRGNYFHAEPGRGTPYTIVIPPPNVTGALHMGHGLDNTLQDILIRWRRMQGRNTLWMPGTDHAGIATQTVVEKRILDQEGKTRRQVGRRALVKRIWQWKDEYEARITGQLKSMGCSCDWQRQRFTLDEMCARAVRRTFFRLFRDGLIYRGKRLVNWDPATETTLADDEVEYETVQGHFWYVRYPLSEPVVLPRGTGILPVDDLPVVKRRGTGILPVDDVPVVKRHGANLPHWSQAGASYAVTFRLADSLPAHVAESWQRQRAEIQQRAGSQGRSLTWQERKELHELYEARVESELHIGRGKCHLKNSEVARIVQDTLKHFHGDRYELIAWAIMPNHAHVIVRPLGSHQLPDILHSWKSFTAKEANRALGCTGPFWQEEYYDHLIRDEEDFGRAVQYVISNPQRAGLRDWPWVGMQTDQGQDGPGTHGQDARATVITHLVVATTRPETMLGDTAVAVNPQDPRYKEMIGRTVTLPLMDREIPIIADDYVDRQTGTGCLKVTPGHDFNDWAIGLRHDLPVINVLNPDGTINEAGGPYAGLDRFEARHRVVEDLQELGLVEKIEDYTHEVGHSYRSHVPIEPYLSDQWYVAVKAPQKNLSKAAGEAVSNGRVRFHPRRYTQTYLSWIDNLRDWPISRQLWWGHRIPIWSAPAEVTDEQMEKAFGGRDDVAFRRDGDNGTWYVCPCEGQLGGDELGDGVLLEQDPDVLDTWFSSALWPHSTLGWPEETPELDFYYPGNTLVTDRGIITLWVSRMVMMGLYNLGEVPFSDVFIHATILDGHGVRMSKSKGNGIDPVDIITTYGADAMRFTLAQMTTESQDIRMPVEKDKQGRLTSTRFDIGRNFCNKFWNAARFVFMNLAEFSDQPFDRRRLQLEDRWILSRLTDTVTEATAALEGFRFHDCVETIYSFFWSDFCDWYLEVTKPRMKEAKARVIPQKILAYALDRLLRLLHPFVPHITETLWQHLNQLVPDRSLDAEAPAPAAEACTIAAWPEPVESFRDGEAETDFALLQATIRAIRNIRARMNIPPRTLLAALIKAPQDAARRINASADTIAHLAALEKIEADPATEKPPAAATEIIESLQVYVPLEGVIDLEIERERLGKRIAEQEKFRTGSEKKLSNENFVSRAKPEVVQAERDRLAKIMAELAALKANLKDLQ